jgi:peptidoglycan hydrolase-like protein with peptidoglycan-binding domain
MLLDLRPGSPRIALLLALAFVPAIPGTVLAQIGTGFHPAAAGLQIAQFSSTVQELQRELNQLGYSAGPADGLIGGRTRDAIQAYQRDHNLLVDGQATPALLSHVRATAQSRIPAPAPPPPPPEPWSQQIVETQEALRSLGYTGAWPTGRLTEETRAAIRSYEADHGLLVTGEPSAALLQHMRQRVEAAAPPPTAVDAGTIAGIQSELRLRGYAIHRVSGRMDAQTRQAIREYQQGQGVPATGEPSTALLDELRDASAEPAPADSLLSREERAAAQRALNSRGFDAGPPDGVLGPRSRVAIRTFQADNALPPTGELTPHTLELLGVIAAATPEPLPAEVQPHRLRVRDDFADGDYTRNPTWRIASGSFQVRSGGLNSVTAAPSQRVEDIGRQILGDILRQQLGVPLGGETAAVAYLPIRIAEEFQITAVVSGSAESHSHVDLGPYRGDRLNHGYRLSYRASESRPLQLLLADENGASVIASSGFRLEGAGPQELVWKRDADGRMTVTRDGEVLIDIVDGNLTGDFDGFSLINRGGEWTLHEVIIKDRG